MAPSPFGGLINGVAINQALLIRINKRHIWPFNKGSHGARFAVGHEVGFAQRSHNTDMYKMSPVQHSAVNTVTRTAAHRRRQDYKWWLYRLSPNDPKKRERKMSSMSPVVAQWASLNIFVHRRHNICVLARAKEIFRLSQLHDCRLA